MSSLILITKLRPFIIICQIYGFIPFSMETDPVTGEIQRFTFSLKNFVTWWYAFVLVVQVTCFLISMVFGGKYVTDAKELGISPIVLSLTSATQLTYMAQVFVCRIVVLKLKSLRGAITLIYEVEQHLKVVVQKSRDSIHQRVIFGVLFATIMVTLLTSRAFQILEFFMDTSNSLVVPDYTAFQVSAIMTAFCSLLLMHLSYYIIAHLTELLTNSLSSKSLTDNYSEIDKLKMCRYIFGCLCKATIELNRVYSFLTLVTVSSKMITTVYSLFALIYQLQKPNLLMSKAYSLNAASVFMDMCLVLTFFTAADMPIIKARILRERLIVSCKDEKIQRDTEFKIEVMCFLMQIEEDRIRLSGSGLFQAGMHLVPSLAASIITYLVILLQTQ